MRFIEAFPAADGDRLQPVVAADISMSRLHESHERRERLGHVHALGVWEISNLSVTGFPSHLFFEGSRFSDPSVEQKYVSDLIERGSIDPLAMSHLPDLVIEEPAVVFVGWGREVFGHMLVDTAPRVAIAEKALNLPRSDLQFLLPRDAPGWLREVIALTGAQNFIEYDPRQHNPLLRTAHVATLPWNMALHPASRDLFAQMRPQAGAATDMIYVTRRKANVTRKINLRNADEIEAIASSAGLRVVAPEQMPVAAQAKMFAEARLIVGEYGSALMNAVFCRPGTVVAAIGTRDKLLSAISALCALRAGFFTPDGDVNDTGGYDANPEAFRHWLEALIEASEDAEEL